MIKRKTVIKIIYFIYLILLISFIFSNSLTPKSESASQSGRALGIVNSILEAFHIPKLQSDFLIRKAGHFIEFFILGASLFGYSIIEKSITANNAVYTTFTACLVAMGDETIQYFSGRGSMLLDVWLDLFSSATAIWLIYCFYKLRHKKSSSK